MLKAHIDSLLKIRRLHSELDNSLNRLDSIGEYHRRLAPGRSRTREIIGRSSLIKEVSARIDMFKNLELPVLISGESGTGKQLAAEAMHWEGKRASEPLVQINCAGLQESLLESELFGYAKGAFTGADRHKKGLIEVAERGTLFVDEIGDMTGAVQAKVLTVLDSGLFRRLGETTERKANVRIIAATNRYMEREIKKGRFRLDLFYRLNVLTINMPPLRKRKEDIPMLVDYFFSHSSLTKTTEKTFSAQAMEAFQKYDWPGNVRELCNVVERAVLFSGQDNEIALRHLPPELTRRSGPGLDDYQPSGMMTLRELEAVYIKEVLKKEESNRTRAARMLGISRSTLKKKIADWGLAE
jgi:transcriptional regulator with PAS, ATPase and Fis domain